MSLALAPHRTPGERQTLADHIVAAAKSAQLPADTAKRYTAWKKQNGLYDKAAQKVEKAEAALEKQRTVVADKDVAQDAAVGKLAIKLQDDGFPKGNPFARVGDYPPPARLQAIAYEKEAKLCLALVKDVRRTTGVTAPTLAAGKVLEAAANAVQAELKKITPLTKAHTSALSEREALAQDWETRFAAFKSSVKTAETEGAKGLTDRLFKTDAPARAPRAPKNPPPNPPAASKPGTP